MKSIAAVAASSTTSATQLLRLASVVAAQMASALTAERKTILSVKPVGPEKAAIALASHDALKVGGVGAGVETAVELIASAPEGDRKRRRGRPVDRASPRAGLRVLADLVGD